MKATRQFPDLPLGSELLPCLLRWALTKEEYFSLDARLICATGPLDYAEQQNRRLSSGTKPSQTTWL
jgi:hypothetical protein